MRIDIYELYLDTLDEIAENERGQLGVPLFNRLFNKAIRWVIDGLTGRLDEMDTAGRTLEAIGKTQKISDLCFPLVRKQLLGIVRGKVGFPPDYDWYVDLRATGSLRPFADCKDAPLDIDRVLAGGYGFQQVKVTSHDKISNLLNSNIPNLRKKLCAEQDADGFQCYPYTTQGAAFLVYLKTPAVAELVQQHDSTYDTLVYDVANSKQPELHTKLQGELSRRIALYFMQMTRETPAVQLTGAINKID